MGSFGALQMRWLIGVLAALLAQLIPMRVVRAQDVERGEAIYRTWCQECHGEEGKGDGPAADRMLPRPRDFVAARYQIRTTASGELPTDDDLMRVMREGLAGTAMPGSMAGNRDSNPLGDAIHYIVISMS